MEAMKPSSVAANNGTSSTSNEDEDYASSKSHLSAPPQEEGQAVALNENNKMQVSQGVNYQRNGGNLAATMVTPSSWTLPGNYSMPSMVPQNSFMKYAMEQYQNQAFNGSSQMMSMNQRNGSSVPVSNENQNNDVSGHVQYLNGPPSNSYLSKLVGSQKLDSINRNQFMIMSQENPMNPQYSYTFAPYAPNSTGKTSYTLQLLSVKEFTVQAHIVAGYGQRIPVPVTGLRIHIKKLSKGHGKAAYEKFKRKENVANNSQIPPGIDGRWRIPLGCYQAFFGYMVSQDYEVTGIPENQLKIATLGAQLADKSYPSVETLVEAGVPNGLSNAMAPYQRGGVDFVMTKHGRALIADEMGLGKTVQAIASMAVYKNEWPLLVLTPSGARYHWETEFMQWLGTTSDINGNGNKSFENPWADSDEDDLFEDKSADNSNDENLDELLDSSVEKNSDDDEGYEDFNALPSFDEFGFSCRLKRIRQKDTARKTYSKRPRHETVPSNINDGLLCANEVHVMTSGKDLWNDKTKVVIVSYGLAPSLIKSGKINQQTFACVICDESHMLKNLKTQRTAALIPILKASKRCLMLSGTPAFARPQELFPQLTVIGANNSANGEEWWQDHETFLAKYCKTKSESNIGGKNLGELHTLLESTVMIRRLKANILKELPKKLREKAYINISDDGLRAKLGELMRRLRKGKGVLGTIAKEHWEHEGRKLYEQDTAAVQLQRLPMPQYEEGERKQTLSNLFTLTGMAKVPIVVAKLKEWLANPLNGKICIFAHHRSVLDEIEKLALRRTQYIRIDGSTPPRARQERICSFQRNPRMKVALLGVTAAGVAVTLTASSTVWFAELFWTPAILIQAEDRVHRIGQQSEVRCLYFIARGTLDEILWKLVEKKFHALGEFVEGKGKSLAVHRDGRIISRDGDHDSNVNEYNSDESGSIEELSDSEDDREPRNEKGSLTPKKINNRKSSKRVIVDSDVDSDDNNDEVLQKQSIDKKSKIVFNEADDGDLNLPNDINSLFANDPHFMNEIADLAKEERRSMGPKDDEADLEDVDNRLQEECENQGIIQSEITQLSDDEEESEITKKGYRNTDNKDKSNTDEGENNLRQNSIENPISILSDDENDKVTTKETSVDKNPEQAQVATQKSSTNSLITYPSFEDLKYYKMKFSAPSYGIIIVETRGKIIVKGLSDNRKERLGPKCKPHAGDIVVSINNIALPPLCDFRSCVQILRNMMIQFPHCVEIVFAETKQSRSCSLTTQQTMSMPYPHETPLSVQKSAVPTVVSHEDENGIICIDDNDHHLEA